MVITYEAAEKDGQLVLHSSRGNYSNGTLESMLNLLLDGGSADRFCWDLDSAITPILRCLTHSQCQELYATRVTKASGFRLFYYPTKVLRVSAYRNNRLDVVALYYLGQFYPDDIEQPLTLQECVSLAENVIQALASKGITSHKYTSPIALFTEELETLDLPRYYYDKDTKGLVNNTGLPLRASCYATLNGSKSWIEAIRLGFFQQCYHYDLKSAYSRIISTLYDTRECDWVKSTTIPPNAVYGTGKAIITVNDDTMVSPILLKRKGTLDISPTGVLGKDNGGILFMLPELQWLDRWHTGSYEIIEGHFGIPRRRKQPYKFIYDKVLAYRNDGPLWNTLAKRMLNGLYGLQLQTKDNGDKLGDFYNSMVGATVSSSVNCLVADTIYKYKVQPYLTQIAVDSFSTTKEIDMDEQDKTIWRLAHSGPQLVAGSGLVFEGIKKPHSWTLEELLNAIKEQPHTFRYSKCANRRMTLGEAVDKDTCDRIGDIIEAQAVVALSGDRDREYENDGPRTGYQLMSRVWDSVPIHIES